MEMDYSGVFTNRIHRTLEKSGGLRDRIRIVSMIKKIPPPVSGGLILSYRCTAECRHCMYACTPRWKGDWISHQDLESILAGLSGKIQPSPYGPDAISLNHGLHITGGEPFMNFDLLVEAVEMSSSLGIPSLFVETNCFWCGDDRTTEQKLRMRFEELKPLEFYDHLD